MKPSIEECLLTINEICKNLNLSEEELKHRARLLFFINRLDFGTEMLILFEEILYQRNK